MSTTASGTASPGREKVPYLPLNRMTGEEGPFDVIVVGSGMGGMSCAAALAKYGRRVLVLEQHYVAGGFTHTFSRKGYTWDVGVHCLGEMQQERMPGRILEWLSDGKIRMESLGDIYERFMFPDGFVVEYPAARDAFRAEMERLFPNDKEAIARYFELVREAVRSARNFFALRALPQWLDFIVSGVVKTGRKEWWARTTKEVLDEITPNDKLKAALTAIWGYYGSTPSKSSFGIHAVVVRHFWNGGFYPVGGASVIAENLLGAVKAAGGAAFVRATVETILVENGKAVGVRLTDGREIRAKKVISAAGARATVERLVPEEYRATEWGKEIAGFHQSPPHVCMYMGFKGDIAAAGATKANQWLFETWDMEDAEWDVSKPDSVPSVLYVSFPTLKDPAHDPGPENRHTGEVVTFVPWSAFEKWKETRRGKRDAEYAAFKKGIEERMLAQMRKRHPKLMALLDYHELSTPLSTTFFTRSPEGAIYGLEATPKRFLSRHLRTRTPIKGLYMTGGDVASLGVVGALVGGMLTASSIEKRVFKHLL